MPRLSILIPCLGDARDFEDTLISVLQNRPDDCEVLVAHARPYDDPYRLSGEVCFVHVPEARENVALINTGFDAARSAVIHVLQCGIEVEEGWVEPAMRRFADDLVAAVSPVIVDRHRKDRLLTAGRCYSTLGRCSMAFAGKRLDRIGANTEVVSPTLLAGFYRRSWWRLLRLDETLGDDFADVQLGLSLKNIGARCEMEPGSVLFADKKLIAPSLNPFGFTTARRAERLFRQNREPNSSKLTLAGHALVCLIEALGSLPSPRAITGALGRITSLFEANPTISYRKQIEQVCERLRKEAEESTIQLPMVRPATGNADSRKKRAA